MVKPISVVITGLLVLFATITTPLSVYGQGMQSTENQPVGGGPLRKLHKKIRNMRPRIRMRKAMKNAKKENSSSTKEGATAPSK